MSTATFATLARLDGDLAKQGHPAMSPWWQKQARRFYGRNVREWIARVGRGGAKSTMAVKVAVNETLCGSFVIPPGERHYFAFVSVRQDEALQRLRLIESYLNALGIKYTRSGDTIDIADMPRGFKVLPATIGAVSGFRCIGWASDEAAKWRNADNSANPAAEVIASMRAMTVTHPGARGVIFSSPFSTLDYHHDRVEEGDTDRHVVSIAPTWIANPSITEAQTRALEPDGPTWSREYAAIPMDAAGVSYFDPSAIAACVDESRPLALPPHDGAAEALEVADLSYVEQARARRLDVLSGGESRSWGSRAGIATGAGSDFAFAAGGDSSALALVFRRAERFELATIEELRGEGGALKPSVACQAFAATMKRYGVDEVMADGWYRESIREHLDAAGISLVPRPEGNSGVISLFSDARAVIHEGRLKLPRHKKLIQQLREVVSKPTPSGLITITSPRKAGSGHGDLASALVLGIRQATNASDIGSAPPGSYAFRPRRW